MWKDLRAMVVGGVCATVVSVAMGSGSHAQGFPDPGPPFIGEIRYTAFNFAPTGWAQCNGQILPIAQNTALFALLGTTYGGNGQTTFALPNMQSRFPIHYGQGPGLSAYDLGQMGGTETVTLTQNQMPQHTHAQTAHTHGIPALLVNLRASAARATFGDPAPALSLGASAKATIYSDGAPTVTLADGSTTTAATSDSGGGTNTGIAGGSQPTAILPPYLGMNCIIALTGAFPSRNRPVAAEGAGRR